MTTPSGAGARTPDLTPHALVVMRKLVSAFRASAGENRSAPFFQEDADNFDHQLDEIERALLSSRVGAVTPEIDLWRLTWLLRDVADRLPMTDVGRERYVELRGFAEQIERVRARLASPEPSKGVSSPLI